MYYRRLNYKGSTLAFDILSTLWEGFNGVSYTKVREKNGVKTSAYYKTIHDLKKRGLIKITAKNSQKFLEITKDGKLEVLLLKSILQGTRKRWDGKWRVIMFDIPEETRHLRNQLRSLLYRYGFTRLQASVFINPYPLNREAIAYLKETGLIEFIRILKVEEMDTDSDLRKKYHLS